MLCPLSSIAVVWLLFFHAHMHTYAQMHKTCTTCGETPLHTDTDNRYIQTHATQTYTSAHADIHIHMHICLHTHTYIHSKEIVTSNLLLNQNWPNLLL